MAKSINNELIRNINISDIINDFSRINLIFVIFFIMWSLELNGSWSFEFYIIIKRVLDCLVNWLGVAWLLYFITRRNEYKIEIWQGN